MLNTSTIQDQSSPVAKLIAQVEVYMSAAGTPYNIAAFVLLQGSVLL